MPNEDAWRIRRYVESDESSCRACIVELQEAERRFDPRLLPGEVMAEPYLQQMHTRCRERAGTILVAEADGAVVGLVMLLARVPFEALDEPPGDCALVAELVVRDRYQGRGIGAALLREAERYARNAGARDIRISVLSGNDSALRLYRRAGFAPYLETLAKTLDLSAESAD